MLRKEVGPDANIIPSRFIRTNKHPHNEEPVFKACFVLGGHREKEKAFQTNYSANMKQSSIRIVMDLATILGSDIWSLDVKQVYLQSAKSIQRKVYIEPKEMDLVPGELLEVILPP